MVEGLSWGLVGYGTIGSELARQVAQPEVARRMQLNQFPDFVVRSSGLYVPDADTWELPSKPDLGGLDEIEELPDALFVALPSTDEGTTAMSIIRRALSDRRAVVTAEKGAVANFFDDLWQISGEFDRFGYDATVGGGTKMLSHLRLQAMDVANVQQAHFALNGTLNYIFESVGPQAGAGMSLGQAVSQAVELGYAEPGASSAHDVIRGEAEGDIPKKTSILFNTLRLDEPEVNDLFWKDLEFTLKDDEIEQVVEEALIRRFIVSLYSPRGREKMRTKENQDVVGGFSVEHEGWLIIGGFRNMQKSPLLQPLAHMSGPANGYVIGLGPDESDGVYMNMGPGAGPRPTVGTMLDDHLAMLNRRVYD